MRFLPGEEIDYTVSYLEMDEPPELVFKEEALPNTLLIKAKNPPVNYFLNLYERVGEDYEWTDKLFCKRDDVEKFLFDGSVEFFTFLIDGWTAGFFILDRRKTNICELAYFGLVPDAVGRGYGTHLLKLALKMSWGCCETNKVIVNTNSLDHPRAILLYEKMGFKCVRTKNEKRILTRSRVIIEKQCLKMGRSNV